jgi:DNA repair protein RAD7
MIEKAQYLSDIELRGANLVTNDKWIDLFVARGKDLKSFKVEWLDASFDDQAVEALATFCPNLERLKLERCKLIGADSIDAISRMEHLKHLTLRFHREVPMERMVNLISTIGGQLETLCLEHFLENNEDCEPTDKILETIHNTCTSLRKFRFTENSECSDAGYVSLFSNWSNPPLHYVDLNSTRDIDNSNPDGPEDAIGLGSAGFQALMQHSGSALEFLDISSCRHITHETFADVFDGEKQYPKLREINLSFCPVVDTQIVAAVFRCCPKIQKVVTFGCFQVMDVTVPRGIVLIGAPKAHDAIEQFGDTLMEFQKEMQAQMDGSTNVIGGRVVPVMG